MGENPAVLPQAAGEDRSIGAQRRVRSGGRPAEVLAPGSCGAWNQAQPKLWGQMDLVIFLTKRAAEI